jgi:hypothetical protein
MFLPLQEKKYSLLFATVVVVCLGLALNLKYLNKFPKHIHAWAQTDRYALALGFIDNDFDFFHPQTMVLNHQFPNAWLSADEQSTTSVDFPIHEYLVGGLMFLFQNESPAWFRSYTIVYSLVGLFFLFLLARGISQSTLTAFLTVLLIATSPVFVYYQGGFLPSIPSFANACIGLYAYYRYRQHKRTSLLWISFGFLTLAALSRTTFAIPLLALFCTELTLLITKKGGSGKMWRFVLPFLLIVTYFSYNLYLRNTFGSIFLSSPLPPKNLTEALDAIATAVGRWGTDYFSPYHYLAFTCISGFALWQYKPTWKKLVNNHFSLFTLWCTLGVAAFTVLMLLQFPDHDYYFLDTWLLPVACWTIVALRKLFLKGTVRQAVQLSLILILITPLFLYAQHKQQERYTTPEWSKLANTVENFTGAKALLQRAQIPDTASVLVFDPQTPNGCFILMGQRGYAMMLRNPTNIAQALEWPFDYALLQKQYFLQDIYADYPQVANQLTYIAANQDLSLVKKTTHSAEGKDPLSLLGFAKMQSPWSAQPALLEIAPEHTYGAEIQLPLTALHQEKNTYLWIEAEVVAVPEKPVFLVCSGRSAQGNLFFQAQELSTLLKNPQETNHLQTLFKIPKTADTLASVSFMLWNPQGTTVQLKKVDLRLLK